MCPEYERTRRAPDTVRHARQRLRQVAPGIAGRIAGGIPESLVHPLWQVCKMEMLALTTSTTCPLFSPEDAAALEAVDDLENFWAKGPGNAINYDMACVLVDDILSSMSTITNGTMSPLLLDIRHGHAESLLPLIGILGLFHNLTDSSSVPHRAWRTSHIVPYSANLAFHTYACADGQFIVQLLHNELPIPIPFCDNALSCPSDVFQRHLHRIANRCDLGTMCKAAFGASQSCPSSWQTLLGTVLGFVTSRIISFIRRPVAKQHDL
ncbi:Histidine phosphatase superfamily (branch 2) [Plasmodiophora brassicae]|nr:hypothetical protein PBRA_009110 [Plasmodiophora brassicae]